MKKTGCVLLLLVIGLFVCGRAGAWEFSMKGDHDWRWVTYEQAGASFAWHSGEYQLVGVDYWHSFHKKLSTRYGVGALDGGVYGRVDAAFRPFYDEPVGRWFLRAGQPVMSVGGYVSSQNTYGAYAGVYGRWQPGLNLGGPLIKDKIWFFGGAYASGFMREYKFDIDYPNGTTDGCPDSEPAPTGGTKEETDTESQVRFGVSGGVVIPLWENWSLGLGTGFDFDGNCQSSVGVNYNFRNDPVMEVIDF
jgi:hypothetical protein